MQRLLQRRHRRPAPGEAGRTPGPACWVGKTWALVGRLQQHGAGWLAVDSARQPLARPLAHPWIRCPSLGHGPIAPACHSLHCNMDDFLRITQATSPANQTGMKAIQAGRQTGPHTRAPLSPPPAYFSCLSSRPHAHLHIHGLRGAFVVAGAPRPESSGRSPGGDGVPQPEEAGVRLFYETDDGRESVLKAEGRRPGYTCGGPA